MPVEKRKRGRPSKAKQVQTREETQFKSLTQEVVGRAMEDDREHLKVREMAFCRLVAEEGFTYTDAYRETFHPSADALPESIRQLASRVAARPRCSAEIERIRAYIKDKSVERDLQMSIALDGPRARDRMIIETYAMAVNSEVPMALRLKAIDMMMSYRHVDGYANGTVQPESAGPALGYVGNSADEAKKALMAKIQAIRASRVQTIELAAETSGEELAIIRIPERGDDGQI